MLATEVPPNLRTRRLIGSGLEGRGGRVARQARAGARPRAGGRVWMAAAVRLVNAGPVSSAPRRCAAAGRVRRSRPTSRKAEHARHRVAHRLRPRHAGGRRRRRQIRRARRRLVGPQGRHGAAAPSQPHPPPLPARHDGEPFRGAARPGAAGSTDCPSSTSARGAGCCPSRWRASAVASPASTPLPTTCRRRRATPRPAA